MATRKIKNFLPNIFRTDTNEKFLSATMDQLVSEPNLQTLYGYIGRTFAPTYKSTDSYVIESTADRQHYQLEPSVVISDQKNNVTFFATYLDLLDKIKHYGGFINNHSRLFEQEYYSFDPLISYDKFVNFSQYYWMPNGPDAVDVSTTGVDLTITYAVIRDAANGRYIFKNNGVQDNSIILARGGVYKFVVDQPGYPFWIQSELGVDGKISATPTLSSRDILGVENNGIDVGTVTFLVPQSTAQDNYLAMTTVAEVAYANPVPYSALENKTVSQFLAAYPQYGGITGTLNGKEFIFVDNTAWSNLGEEAWTNGNVTFGTQSGNGMVGSNTITFGSLRNIYANLTVTGTGIPNNTTVISVDTANLKVTLSANLTANTSGIYTFTSADYNPTYNVPNADRFGIWKAVYIDAGITKTDGSIDYLVQLVPTQSVNYNEKVYVKYGLGNANKEYYKDIDGFFTQIPQITATLPQLWIQDSILTNLYQRIQVIEYSGWSINVDEDIIGQQVYTSPNGVDFTSGLKIQFGDDVTPSTYQNRQFYVEQVGDIGGGIQLVPVDELVTPELFNDENALNYPLIRVVLSSSVTEAIPTGTIITIGGTDVQLYQEVLLGQKYITTLTPIDPTYIGAEVIGTGIPAGTVALSVRLDKIFPDYITINRSSLDRNAWARNNRWFHVDVIVATAEYNDTSPLLDQGARAQRPIVQYEANIQLINDGRVAKAPIDILDTSTTNAFTELQGKNYTKAFGVTLTDGMRVVFGADQDPLVRNKIYVLSLVQYLIDSNGLPTGDKYIELTPAEDSDVATYSSVVVKQGQYKGSQWWYDGVNWNSSQQKTALNQSPLFDVFDRTGRSLTAYPRTTFIGTQIFGYRIGTGTADPVLGFPLSYKTFRAQGDINFQNYFNTDTFDYADDAGTIVTSKINLGYLQKIQDANTLIPKNTWQMVPENSRQYQQISYVYDGTNSPFTIDVTPSTSASIPTLKVFQNYTYLGIDQWTLVDNKITLGTTLTIGDQIDILIASSEISKLGFYQVPQNLDLNAQNIDIDTLTLGQMRNHLVALAQNSTKLIGNVLASSNLRDIDIKQQGGTILQHSAPVPYASLFLIDRQANFVNSVQFAQQEYTKFKNKFLELSLSLPGINANDPVASVDTILAKINQIKNKTFPWYYSDMVPYGSLKNIVGQIGTIDGFEIFNPLKLNYEITQIFNDKELSNKAVLVYLNNQQLIKNVDYNFSTDTPSINFTTTLAVGDIVKIVEYSNTDGNYIPETPTKLGLWPTFIPEIFLDDTYRDPTNVIRGHDGSITPAFGDYRDQFLLELELRIYNNIKLPLNSTFGDIFRVIPGKFRASDYTLAEINQLISQDFLNWLGNNKLDFSDNNTFDPNDPFTWNYADSSDRINNSKLQGSWRACYQYFYDTIRPHLTPWEMLGFATVPDWWEVYYGPAPYTGGNKLLWDDLEAGLIRYGDRAGIDLNYRRPGLSKIIPVDENGFLLPPAKSLTQTFTSNRAASAWAIGQYGPVEFAWRISSEFPFAVQQALAMSKPAKYFGSLIDTYNYSPLNLLYSLDELSDGTIIGSEQYLTLTTNHHITQNVIDFNGDTKSGTVYRGSGYINWIADYLTNQGINPANYILPMLENFQVKLGYKLAGFTDKRYLEVLAEQVSPTSTNSSVLIPDENYKVYLNQDPVPIDRLIYSAVIVEKTNNGWSVRGYDLVNSYFTVIPSVVNNNASKITVLNKSATIYRNYQNLKLKVPYGYEFTTPQQLADFLISYERYLIAQGFTFTEVDPNLGELRNFKLSVKEFLYWIQQGWKPGSIIVLSPVAETINAISVGAITSGIEDSQFGSKVLDQNFNLIKNNNYTVMRTPTNFKLALNNAASVIGYIEINLVQYEHALIFDNITVFSDVIYQPESGNRQFRLKLVGQKTAAWDGSLSPPGFMYSTGVVAAWNQGKDYLQGDIVEYKNQYYTALQNVIANPSFQFQYWQQIDNEQITSGLLSNFSTLAVQSQGYYDPYAAIKDEQTTEYSHALIGYKPRQYLSDLGLSGTTQIEFYKGFIKQKGTANAINEMLTATFSNLNSDIKFYEEWAVRVGEYGALSSNPFIEIPLDERAFGVNPSVARLVAAADNNLADGINTFNESQLYKSYGTYTGNIALYRNANSNYDNDIPTAGYVNIDDVDLTIFDLANYVDLDNNISQMGSGYLIWCAKDFTQDWNVYRVTETNNSVTQVANSLDGYITFSTKRPHNLVAGSIFLVKDFNSAFDGFYQVYKVMSLNQIMVTYSGSTANLTTLSGNGMLFRMDSMRFKYMEFSRVYGLDNPPNGWKVGDKIWIDIDAETTAVQGQPYGTQPSGTWKVYEKQAPWAYEQQLLKSAGEYNSNDGYGTSLKMSADGLIVVSGSPQAGTTGVVYTFLKNYLGEFIENFNIVPLGANTKTFGTSVDLSSDAAGSSLLAVGAPNSYANVGYVYVYSKSINSSSYERSQILVGNVGDQFGSSLAFNQNGEWLYVGAPGKNTMYAYGLNRFIPVREQIISVNNENTLFFSNTVTAAVGDTITQPVTGAIARVLRGGANVGNLIITTLTNFIYTANVVIANVTVNANVFITSGAYVTDTGVYPTGDTRVSITSNLTITGFTPVVTNDPASLLITTGSKTFVPNVEYVLNGSIIEFINNGNIASPYYIEQADYSIKQRPYYQLVEELPIPTGNTSAQYGYALSSSFGGEQVAVGAPGDTVLGEGGKLLPGAGSVYVWDRVIEAFNTITDAVPGTAGQDYRTANPIASVYKVTLDNIEVNDYIVVGTNTIRFVSPPPIGRVMFVEVNKFNLLERLVGVDSLEGGLKAIQANAQFGTSLTICSNNCAIYVGAPGYDNGREYNSGAVWKFHNRGRLYGTNTGYTIDPVFTPNDTLRLNDFEVTVTGRMMPTANANVTILTVSSNVRANIGEYITQSSSSANVIVTANTAVTGSKHITVANNFTGANVVFKFGDGNVVSIAGTASTVHPMASLDSLVKDVNDAGILGVTAVNEADKLRLNSDVKVAKDQLRIVSGVRQPGSPGVYAEADLIIFAFMQIIIPPYGNSGEYFGNKVKLAANAYMLVIGSRRGTTRQFTTFDVDTTELGTVFDDSTTRWADKIQGSGSVYIYELYDDPRNDVEDPGRYAFAQQLDASSLTPGSQFGTALDIEGTFITVSAPGSTIPGAPDNSGTIYIFTNPAMTRGWDLIRYQSPKVDIDSLSRLYLYDSVSNTIKTDVQFIDPAKGRILGQAEQDITYKTEYDPAIYNNGSDPSADINKNVYWGANQVGKVWWNLSNVRYLDYEQDTLTYRSLYWGQLFPGSTIEVCEWVQSSVLPSQYVLNNGNGQPKYANDGAYVEEIYVDPVTGIITTRYYYWVINKTSVDPNDESRNIPITSIQDIIANPKNQNIPYAALIRGDAIAFYNVNSYLSADNTIMHLDHQAVINTDIIHSEYQLIQKGNPEDTLPSKIVNKLVDSLAGIDLNGASVPDPTLSPADRYGIGVRPRQSMFEDRLAAVSQMVAYVNSILIDNAVTEQFSLAGLEDQDPTPNIKLGEYDLSVATEVELEYIDTTLLDPGYLVLVLTDTTQDGLWTLWQLSNQKLWSLIKIQSYKTSLYWEYADWYGLKDDGTRYSTADKPTFSVDTTVDALKLNATAGSLIYISNASGDNTWQLVEVNTDGSFKTVGLQNGTIQLSQTLADFVGQSLGFGNQDFDSNRYDQNPNQEIRSILLALYNDIFINTLEGEFNNMFFVLVSYLLTEQNYVDWIFKSSFISITHKLRTLSQFPSYVVDNQTYYEDYINEVKPYRTKIREYLIDYTGNDTFGGDITDFDLPAYYDTSTGYGIFRSPSGERPYVQQDEATWQTWPYNQWYDNRSLRLDSVRIVNPGTGYILPPVVVITSTDGNGNGAAATATLDGNTGSITAITVTNSGSGYTAVPGITINGTVVGNVLAIGGNVNLATNTYTLSTISGLFVGMTANAVFAADSEITSIDRANSRVTMSDANITSFTGNVISFGYPGVNTGTVATAYAVMKNPMIRSFDTAIKFDRVSYSSSVKEWAANTAYTRTTFDANGRVTGGDIITHSMKDGNVMVRKSYYLTANATTSTTFISTDYVEFAANRFDNANDRIVGYYEPGPVMPVVDVVSIPITLANARSNTNTIYIFPSENIFNGMYISNLGVQSAYITNIVGNVDVNVMVSGSNISAKCAQITLSSNIISLNKDSTITARYESLDQLVPGVTYPSAPIVSPGFTRTPLFGRSWDITAYDGVQYSQDGLALLSTNAYDIALYSLYSQSLGVAPEDLITSGGEFVDTYHSRAPEELVPGITFDSLDMRVYTKINGNANVIAYRVFNNILGSLSYLRISSANATALTESLSMADSEIYVTDASVLGEPNVSTVTPGVVFINGERITYYRNYSKEVTPWTASTSYTSGSILSYGNVITFSSNITANRGEYIAQAQGNIGANAIVTANVVNSTSVPIYYISGPTFILGANTIQVTTGINSVQVIEIETTGWNANANVWYPNTNIRVSTTSVLSIGTEIQFSNNFGNVVGNITYYIESVYGNAATSITTPVSNVIRIANTPAGAAVNDLIGNVYSPTPTANVITIIDYNAYPVTSANAYYKTTGNVNSLTFNYANVVQLPSVNILSQIRRGTQGTATPDQHPVASEVLDAGINQLIPSTSNVSAIATTATAGQTLFSTPKYQLGDDPSNALNLRIYVNNTPAFNNRYNEIASSSYTQAYTGTDGNINTVTVEYGNTITFTSGLSIGDVVRAEVNAYYANVWYNSGVGTVTDGTGFTGSNTNAVNFLREYGFAGAIPGISNALTTEDAINTLTTETDDEIYTED